MNNNITWEDFELKVSGKTLITPTIKFTLYLDMTDDGGMLDFYKRAMDAAGDMISHYKAERMKRRAIFDAKAATIVPTWLERPRQGKDYFIRFSGCDEKHGVSPYTIELKIIRNPPVELSTEQKERRKSNWKMLYEQQNAKFTPPITVLQTVLPVDHKLAEPTKLLDWVLGFQLVKEWPFLSGHCGYALNHYQAEPSTRDRALMHERLCALCLRHPGFDLHDYGVNMLRYDAEWMDKTGYFLPQIKRVNWLTLINSTMVAHLGGQDKLNQKLGVDSHIKTHTIEHGLAIQAGDKPKLGDLARREFIPAYRRVAEVLRPFRLVKISGPGSGFSDEAADEWLNAFEKNYS